MKECLTPILHAVKQYIYVQSKHIIATSMPLPSAPPALSASSAQPPALDAASPVPLLEALDRCWPVVEQLTASTSAGDMQRRGSTLRSLQEQEGEGGADDFGQGSLERVLLGMVEAALHAQFTAVLNIARGKEVPGAEDQGWAGEQTEEMSLAAFTVTQKVGAEDGEDAEEAAEAESKHVCDLLPVVTRLLKIVFQHTRIPAIRDCFILSVQRRLMPLLNRAQLSPAGCVTCIGLIQDYSMVLQRCNMPVLQHTRGLDLCVDRLMDAYDEQSKSKIVDWVSNIVTKEQKCEAVLTGEYYYTYGPSDLFLNINTALSVAVEDHKLTGRALYRVAAMYALDLMPHARFILNSV
jgi:hypothetical protein